MQNVQKKSILIVIGVLCLAVLITVFVIFKSGNSETKGDVSGGSTKTEENTDEQKDSENNDGGGLDVGDAQEAEQSEDNSVEFVAPNTDKVTGQEDGTENKTPTNEDVDSDEEQKEEPKNNQGDLTTENDNAGGYGDFF